MPLSRLHASDIATGKTVIAAHLNDEFNQLVSTANSQDTRITNIESGNLTISGNKTFSGTTTLSGTAVLGTVSGQATFVKNPAGVFAGTVSPPFYASAATITVPAGNMAVTSTNEVITLAANRTLSLASSGAGGLDTGAEASNTWYYVWLIDDSTNVNTPHAVLSTSSSSITLPSGYDQSAVLKGFAIRNDGSSNIIPFTFVGWPYAPECVYDVTITSANGTAGPTNVLEVAAGAAATSYTDVNCAAFIPPFATMGIFTLTGTAGASPARITLRPNGQSHDGHGIVQDIATFRYAEKTAQMKTDASQIIEYKSSVADPKVQVAVEGWRV